MKTKATYYLIFTMLILSSCQDFFLPEVDKKEPILVVDGMITNQEENATVVLTRTTPFSDRNFFKPETNANVSVISNKNKIYNFKEKTSGVYQSEDKIVTLPGESYYLYISTITNEEYRSEW